MKLTEEEIGYVLLALEKAGCSDCPYWEKGECNIPAGRKAICTKEFWSD